MKEETMIAEETVWEGAVEYIEEVSVEVTEEASESIEENNVNREQEKESE